MRDVATATVNILHRTMPQSAGTGFYISENGIILTCKHVLEKGDYSPSINEHIRIWRGDTRENDAGTVVAVSKDNDLAIVQVDSSNNPYLTFAATNEKQFRTTYIGYPFKATVNTEGFGDCPRFTKDILSLDNANTATAGFSGGPLLLENDTVIGIINEVSVPDNNMRMNNYATAISSYAIVKEFRQYIGENSNLEWYDTFIDWPTNEQAYLEMIVKWNCTAHIRDAAGNPASSQWINVYSYPVFSLDKSGTPVPNLLQYNDRLLIVSQSGYGKSQLIQGLSWLYATVNSNLENDDCAKRRDELCKLFGITEPLIPIIIRGKDIVNCASDQKLLQHAVYSVVQDGLPINASDYALLAQKINEGKTILFLDSFDEIKSTRDRNIFQGIFTKFCANHRNQKFVITSRYCQDLRCFFVLDFYKVYLEAFSDVHISEQARKRITDKEVAESAFINIKSNDYLWELAQSPIMLSEMLSTMTVSGKPMKVVRYLARITQKIIEQRWKPGDILEDEDVALVLGGIAWNHLRDNSAQMTRNEIINLFQRACKGLASKPIDQPLSWSEKYINASFQARATALYNELSVESGILILDDENTAFAFQNGLMESYLASLYFFKVLSFCQEEFACPQEKIIFQLHENFKEWKFSAPVMNMLVIAFDCLKPHQQRAVLKYILIRGFFCTDQDERATIVKGVRDLIDKTISDNILNENSTELLYAKKWLNAIAS